MFQRLTLLKASSAKVGLLRCHGAGVQQVRNLNVHEYVAFGLMSEHGVHTPKGQVASSAEEASTIHASGSLGSETVIKAQVLAGGRGRGKFSNGFEGGVKVVASAEEAKKIASQMIGSSLVTKQTGPEGKPCNKVFVMEKLDIAKEAYFSILMDRSHGGPTIVGSSEGGMSIEDVAHDTPEKIFKEEVDVMDGISEERLTALARNMGFDTDAQVAQATETMRKLYDMFMVTDATLIEINPLATTKGGDVFVSDCKLNFDDNAEYRQKAIFAQRDQTQEDPREVEAATYDLNYIGLDGNIGCMVNGAGLAMATMDIIKLNGGNPANFLDVGGGATKGQVEAAFGILNADPKVKAILVNIFGGIMRCPIIAEGIVAAARNLNVTKPIIVRLQGTGVDEAKVIVEESGLGMIMNDNLNEAAKTAVATALGK